MFIVITKKHFIPELARLYDDPDRERWEVAIMENPACLRIPVTLFFLTMQRHMTWKSGTRYFDSYLRLAKAAYLSELLSDELNAEGGCGGNRLLYIGRSFFLYAPRKMHKRGGERRASGQIDRYASVLYE